MQALVPKSMQILLEVFLSALSKTTMVYTFTPLRELKLNSTLPEGPNFEMPVAQWVWVVSQ